MRRWCTRPQWLSADALALLAAFVLFTLPVGLGATDGIDSSIALALQGLPESWLHLLRPLVQLVGGAVGSTGIALFLAIVAGRRQPLRGLAVLSAFAALVVIEIALKRWLHHPGVLRGADPDALFGAGGSYPSGHTGRVVFLAVLITAHLRRWPAVPVALAIWACITAIDLVYFGNHWPSDIVGGALLGYGLGAAARDFTLDAAHGS